jgi:hypothetical protein
MKKKKTKRKKKKKKKNSLDDPAGVDARIPAGINQGEKNKEGCSFFALAFQLAAAPLSAGRPPIGRQPIR